MKTTPKGTPISGLIRTLFMSLCFFLSTQAYSFAPCGFEWEDLTIEVGCDGTLTFYLDGFAYDCEVSISTAGYSINDLEIGEPIVHGTLIFEPLADFTLTISKPGCVDIFQSRLPNWDFKVGAGGGIWYFDSDGDLQAPPPFAQSGTPVGEVIQTIKPTCPMSCDGQIWVTIGPTLFEKCDDFTVEVEIDGEVIILNGPGDVAVFEDLCAGDYDINFFYDMFSCPCMFPHPETIDATIKEPSANTTSLACINETNISADENCKVTIEYGDVALGENDPCMAVGMMDDSIFVYDPHGALLGSGSAMGTGSGAIVFDAYHLIGEKLKVEIRDGATDNWCWGYVHIEDKLPPVITCNDPSSKEVLCLEFHGDPENHMIAHDCDHDATITIINEKTINECDDPRSAYIKMIEMTYFATDKWGNKSNVCTDTMKILRFDPFPGDGEFDFPGTISLPPSFKMMPGWDEEDAINCADDSYVLDQNGNPAPLPLEDGGTGVPVLEYLNSEGMLDSKYLKPINYETDDPGYNSHVDELLSYCKIALTYEDFKFELGCKTKIQRTWYIREWSCEGEQVANLGMQEIHIIDDEGPVFDTRVPDATVTVNTYNCSKYKEVKLPEISDECSDYTELQVLIYDEDWNLIGPDAASFAATGYFDFPLGLNHVVYKAFDKCHNYSLDTADVYVIDESPPVVICKEFLVVGLSADGTVRVPASAFDNGTYDDCHLKSTCVVRMDDQEAFDALDTDEDGWVLASDFEAACDRDYSQYAEHTTINGDTDYFLHRDALCTPDITFCCADDQRGEEDEVFVIFRAKDKDGNSNECMVVVEMQDKSAPSIICPPDVVVDCETPLPGIEDVSEDFVLQEDDPLTALFGKIAPEHEQEPFGFHMQHLKDDFGKELVDGVVFDNCEDPDIYVKTVLDFDQCGTGMIWRTFYAEDASGNRSEECHQKITIDQLHGLDHGNIVWPEDVLDFEGCLNPNDSESLDADRPYIPDYPCTLMGVNSEDEVYTFNTDDPDAEQACFKVIRTWRVIDWCKKDHEGKPYVYEHPQTIKVHDYVGPDLVNPDDNDDDTWGDGGVCEAPSEVFDAENCDMGHVVLQNDATDECTDDEDLVWDVKVVLFPGTPDEEIVYPFNNANDGALFEINDYFPVGTHEVVWTIHDLCGNRRTCKQEFTVLYNKKPTPFANDLTTVLMNTNWLVDVWAIDLNNKSEHQCYNEEDLMYTMARTDTTKTAEERFASSSTYLTFGCDDVGPDGVQVDFFVSVIGTDLFEYTTLTIEIQDNAGYCDSFTEGNETASIKGNISTDRSEMVRDMEVGLQSIYQGSSTATTESMTNTQGDYAFPSMPMGGSYDVKPKSSADYLNGVSTLDLIFIQQHVLGISDIESPYDQIAADINNDEIISAVDIVNLRSVILGRISDFPGNESWRFIDETYDFVSGENALKAPYSESYRIDKLEGEMEVNFVGVKVGDVNGSVAVENVLAGARSRLSLLADNQQTQPGNQIRVPLKFGNDQNVLGLQFTAQFDPTMMNFVGVESSTISISDENLGLNSVDKGEITVSWHSAHSVYFENQDELFELVFVGKSSGELSESLAINSSRISAEVYDDQLMTSAIDLEFQQVDISEESFGLMQNKPNPFSESTTIGFVLPESAKATLTFFDVSGKVLLVRQGIFDKGMNQVIINKNDIPTSGVVYYSLETEKFIDTKRAVILK